MCRTAAAILPIFTSMFLHGSWLHLIFNMWALWIFGDNVEDYLGHWLYLVFYLLCGVAAALLHTLFNIGSTVPSVGASGAIAGVMGAYFLLYPRARVLTLVPFFFVFFMWLPAWIVLGYWFVAQFLSGAATLDHRAGAAPAASPSGRTSEASSPACCSSSFSLRVPDGTITGCRAVSGICYDTCSAPWRARARGTGDCGDNGGFVSTGDILSRPCETILPLSRRRYLNRLAVSRAQHFQMGWTPEPRAHPGG